MMKVATIFLRHGTKKYADTQENMEELFRRRMPGIERDTVVVDTMLPLGYEEHCGNRRAVIGGATSLSGFASAADMALAWMGARTWSYDLVHLATSAFQMLYVKYLERFDTGMLQAIAGRPACVGHIDCYNEPVRLLSHYSQHWIRSCFLFLPPAELLALGSVAALSDKSRIFSGDPGKPFRSDAPLSENYANYITEWLTGQDIGQGVTWHSGFHLTLETLPEFERKTMEILNEHLFAIRLRGLGCRVLDATWLATELAAMGEQNIRWSLGWREQLAARDTDPLCLAT